MRDDSLIIDGITYLPSRVAALRARIVPDYATRLARLGLVRGVRHEGSWYIDPEHLVVVMAERSRHFAEIRERMSYARKSELKRYELESLLSSETHLPALRLPPPALQAFRAQAAYRTVLIFRSFAALSVVGLIAAGSYFMPSSANTLLASVENSRATVGAVGTFFHSISCILTGNCGAQTSATLAREERATAAVAAAATPPAAPEAKISSIVGSGIAPDTGSALAQIVMRPVTVVSRATESPVGHAPLSIVEGLARQLSSLISLVGTLERDAGTTGDIPEHIAASGNGGPAPGGYILAGAVGNTPVSASVTSLAASAITGTITNVIDSVLATIDDLTATEFVAVNATSSTLYVSSSASLATTTIASLAVSGTTTSAGLRISALDCSSYGNGGTLTTDASGNVVCATDDGGAGGTVAGADTQVQFNNGGSFGASAGLTFASTSARLTITNASTTAFSSAYASSTNLFAGLAMLGRATTSVFAITGLTNALLSTNADGTVVATTSIGAAYGGTGLSTIASSSILIGSTGNTWIQMSTSTLGLPQFSDLSSYLTLAAWYSTTTSDIEEGTNLYFTTARATTSFVGNLAATTSVNSITTLANLVLPASQLSGFGTPFYQFFSATTTDALTQGSTNRYYSSALFTQDLAATTSVNSIIALNNLSITASQVSDFNANVNSYIAASTTIPKTYTSNIFAGTQTFTNSSTTLASFSYASSTNLLAGSATTSNLSVTGIAGGSLLKAGTGGYIIPAITGTDYQAAGTYLTALGSGYATTTQLAVTFSTTTLPLNGITYGLTFVPTSGSFTITPTVSGTLDNAGLTNSSLTVNAGSGLSGGGSVPLGSSITLNNQFSTSSTPTTGNLTYWTSPSSFGTIATTTATIGASLLYSGTFGALVGGAAGTLSLNLGNANTWTALQQFVNASSTHASVYSALYVGGTATTTIRGETNATSTFAGGIQGTYLNLTGASATSTAANGFNLTGGCFALNGTCIGGTSQSFAYPFLATTNFGATTNSTTTNLSLFGGLNASSTVRFGNPGQSMLLWDSTTGFLGLGTSTPDTTLNIVGPSGNQDVLVKVNTNSGGEDARLFLGEGSLYGMTMEYDGAANIAYIGMNNAVEAGLDTYSKRIAMNLSGSAVYFPAGDVGVGTTTPWAQLSINPSGITGPAFAIGSSTATSLIVTNGGNVGIGTVAPSARLHLEGSQGNDTIGTEDVLVLGRAINSGVTFQKAAAFALGTYGTSGNSPYSRLDVKLKSTLSSDYTADNTVLTLLSDGNVGIGTTSPMSRLSIKASSNSTTDYPLTIANNAGTTGFQIGAYGLSSKSVIDSNVDYTMEFADNLILLPDGNVGIGTTSPWAQLSINPNGIAGPAFAIGSSTATRFVVTNGGNVGIGETAPTARLHVTNATDITPDANAAGQVRISGNAYSGFLALDASAMYVGHNSGSRRLDLMTDETSRLSISAAGNVGIGSTTPNAALVLRASVPQISFDDSDSSLIASISGNLADLTYNTATANRDHIFQAAGGEIMRLAGTGELGVGTTSPWRKLSVTGTVGFSSTLSTESGSDNYLCIDPTTYEVTNGGANCAASSLRYKENIQDLTYGLDDVLALRPVSFQWTLAERPNDRSTQVGFIAEEMNLVIPEVLEYDASGTPESIDYDKLTAVLARAIQEIARITGAFRTNLIAWFADAANGITEFFAGRVHTREICVAKADGSEFCMNGDQLAALAAGPGAGASSGSAPPPPPPPAPAGDTEAPVITIQGNNPATVQLGDTYMDLGVLVTDNADQMIPVTATLDGGSAIELSAISIDTSAPGSHTIVYTATDSSGNSSSATRTVEVIDPAASTATSTATSTTP